MNWLLDVHMLESCASLVSQFLAMSFQPQKQLPSGKGCCFLEKLTCKKAMSHLMDNQYSLQDACAESTLNGGATWHTICIVGVFLAVQSWVWSKSLANDEKAGTKISCF